MYMRVMKKHELVSTARQELREKKLEESLQGDGKEAKKDAPESDSSESSDEEEIDAEKAELLDRDQQLVGQQIDQGRLGMQTRVSVRNLRIREDTAKYLRNLDVKSAFYDPKTRSMRSNPNPDMNPEELDYAGDNFVRYTGDTRRVASQQLYEFEAFNRGQTVHMQAMPTQAEKLHQQFVEKKEGLQDSKNKKLLDQYGGEEHINAKLPRPLLLGQTEQYVEYSADGGLIKGQEKREMSKYEEDKLTSNHTKIWGSLWHNGRWGFACCGSFIYNSYCTGEAGCRAFEQQLGPRIGQSPLREASSGAVQVMAELVAARAAAAEEEKEKDKARKVAMGERNEGKGGVESFDKKRLKKALKEEEKRSKLTEAELDERKRKYNSMGTVDVTEEEMEAYMLKKSRPDDPMARISGTRGYDLV